MSILKIVLLSVLLIVDHLCICRCICTGICKCMCICMCICVFVFVYVYALHGGVSVRPGNPDLAARTVERRFGLASM